MKKLILLLPILVAGYFILTAQKSQDEQTGIDPRMSRVFSTGEVNTQLSTKPVDFVFSTQSRTYSNGLENITIGPNFRVLPSTNTNQSEVIITRHPINHNIMWASSNATNIGGSLFISEGNYVTTNGGQTWYGSDTLPTTPISGHSGDPGPIIDKDGTFIMTRLGNGLNIWSNWSSNNGISYSTHIPISTSSNDDKNLATTDDDPSSPFYGRSYVAWTRFAGTAGWIYLSYTTNNGQSWSAPQQINNSLPSHFSHGADLRVGPGGVVYVTYANSQSTSPYTEKFLGLAKSTNGGVNWTANEQAIPINGIRTTSFGSYGIRVPGFPRIDVDRSGGPRNGWVYLVSPQNNIGNGAGTDAADMILYYSSNGGTNWSSPIRVNQDTPGNGKLQFFNAIRVDEFGGINVLYYDNRNTTTDSAQAMLSRSVDGGTTWDDYVVSDHNFRPRAITGLAGGYSGDYIGMTSGNSKLWPVWMDNSTGNYQLWTAAINIANFPLNTFQLQTPSAGTTITSFPGSTTQFSATWDTSATGASYKWIFGSPTTNPRLISLQTPSNQLVSTLGQLDNVLAGLGLQPGQSLVGQWDVWAFRPNPPQNDSLKASNGPRSITLARGIPSLSAFNLNIPADNSTITTSVFNNTNVNINWSRSGQGTTYKWKFGAPTISNVLLNVASGNNGFDSSLSFVNSGLDVILGGLGMNPGDTLSGQWAVWAYNGLDSLKSTQTRNITFIRQDKGDVLVMYDSTIATGRAALDTLTNVLGNLEVTFDLFNRGSQTSTNAMTLRGYKKVILLGAATSVMNNRLKDSVIAYLNSGGTTVETKSKFIILAEDIGYQFGRTGSTYLDLNFVNNYLGWQYVADRPASGANQGLIGHVVNSGMADSTNGTWPDVLRIQSSPGSTAQHVLYKFRRHINNLDSASGIGIINTTYNAATLGSDARNLLRATDSPVGPAANRIIKGLLDYVDQLTVSTDPIAGNEIPMIYELSQNYPNPFNPSTKINFAIPKQGMVMMKIFDITGREVAMLVNEVKNPGYYSVDFNASILASGVYFYRLEAQDFIDVKRMVLIK